MQRNGQAIDHLHEEVRYSERQRQREIRNMIDITASQEYR